MAKHVTDGVSSMSLSDKRYLSVNSSAFELTALHTPQRQAHSPPTVEHNKVPIPCPSGDIPHSAHRKPVLTDKTTKKEAWASF